MPDRRKSFKSMKPTYIAILLGGFITAMTASGASYISTKEAVSVHDERITNLDKLAVQNTLVHKDINETLKSMNENNTRMRITLTRLATIIELKVEKGD